MNHISIAGLDKAAVLVALYNAAQAQGMSFMRHDAKPMTIEQARETLKSRTNFDYLQGRVMKVDLSKDEFNPWLYDRNNGAGTAQRVIETLRASG